MAILDPLIQALPSVGYHLLLVVVILAIGWGAGRSIGYALRRVTLAAGIETGFRRTSIGQAILKSGYSASEFVDVTARWVVYAAAILIALLTLDDPSVSLAVDTFLAYFPRLVVALVILIVGLVLSDWFGEFIKRGFPPEQKEMLYLDLVANLLKFVFYFITIILALREAGIDTTILYIFAEAFAWSIAIAVGVAVGIVVGWTFRDRLKRLVE